MSSNQTGRAGPPWGRGAAVEPRPGTNRSRSNPETAGRDGTGHPRLPDRPVGGWASLTQREFRVSELAAEGLTNAEIGERLFLSRHTIDFHLRNTFRKLGVRSRVQLTRVVVLRAARVPSRIPSSRRPTTQTKESVMAEKREELKGKAEEVKDEARHKVERAKEEAKERAEGVKSKADDRDDH